MKKKQYIILFILFSITLFAQQKRVTTSIDTTKNKIGAEFKLTLITNVDTLSKVVFPKARRFGNLEVIRSYKVDTVKKNDRYELIKKYGLTQFDSGKYTIPSLMVVINDKPNYTDSIKIEVSNVKVDTLKQKMYDIKDIAKAERPIGNWWIYILIVIILGIVGFFVYKEIKKRQSQVKPEEIVYKSPIEKATTLLQQLENKQLWQRGEIKNYYSELTDIARNYIEEEIHIPAMESTTSELISSLRDVARNKNLKISKETVENLEKVLNQADLVKFAKSQPLEYEIEEDKKRIANTIVTIHKSIPDEVEEKDELSEWNEQQKEFARLQKIKAEKRKKITVIAASVLGISMLALISVIYIKGFDFVKDNILGNPTKELAEGEWIYSEYGNPGIKIETPKVLKRIDVSKSLPKQSAALIKEMQTFIQGGIDDNLIISVSTMKFKQEDKIDLDTTIDESLKIYEAQGATNIIVKTEDFDTQNGISGKKAYGTMTLLDTENKKSAKMYYELLVFSQDGGIQKIVIMHKEDDKFGMQIAERVLNSVELKKA